MNVILIYLLFGSFFGILILFYIIGLIINYIHIPKYSYEKAAYVHQRAQRQADQRRIILVALVILDIALWFVPGVQQAFPSPLLAFILMGLNLLFVVQTAVEYENLRRTRERLAELETQNNALEDRLNNLS